VIKNVCVYAASSDAVATEYIEAAESLGSLLAERGYGLVYGAGNLGLMGVLAKAVHEGGGHVIGVIPDRLRDLELAYEAADELIVTESMSERKAIMASRADAFVAMPGGFGTLEEILEVLVLKQLWYHQKPIAFLNTNSIYSRLIGFFESLMAQQFIKDSHRTLYEVCETPAEAVMYIESYKPSVPHQKWF